MIPDDFVGVEDASGALVGGRLCQEVDLVFQRILAAGSGRGAAARGRAAAAGEGLRAVFLADGRVAEGNRRVVALRAALEDYPNDPRFTKMPGVWMCSGSSLPGSTSSSTSAMVILLTVVLTMGMTAMSFDAEAARRLGGGNSDFLKLVKN